MAIWNLCFIIVAASSIAASESGRDPRQAAGEGIWPDGIIYYYYDDSVTERVKAIVQRAMDIWESATCLSFEYRKLNETDYVTFYYRPNEEYCTCDSIGMKGGEQRITLGYSCDTPGHLLHTLGHIIGFYNEQSRPDRDDYVKIFTENIDEEEKKNFQKQNGSIVHNQYDYASIMHLSATAYSKNGEITTEVINSRAYATQGEPKLGDRVSLSLQDINETNRLYNCSEGGKGEILRVHIGDTQQPQEDNMNYQVVIVAVDSRGMSHTLSTTAVASDSDRLEWNETLEFPISREQSWQFFQIKIWKSNGSVDIVLSQPQTVVIKVEMYKNLSYEYNSNKNLEYSYECIADGDDCYPNPCNGNNCSDELFDYKCHCPPGYEGKNCSDDGDSCLSNPCHPLNSLSCIDKLFDYACTCKTGFGGKNCERICPHGYDGYNCTLDGNSCQPNLCHPSNSLSCIDELFNYTCTCKTGFEGKNCCIRNYCDPNPCNSTNTRYCSNGLSSYTCVCKTGYKGINCDTRNYCDPNLCNSQNTVACRNGRSSYTCVCKTGYIGTHCDTRNYCDPNPCNSTNTRYCSNGRSSYTCVCKTGYIGTHCDTRNYCDPNLCNSQNTRYCSNGRSSYTCVCKTGYIGTHCDTRNYCDPNLCNSQNTRYCSNGRSSYTCVCKTGYIGTHCDTRNYCDPNLCNSQNTRYCSNGRSSYTCVCKTGFEGSRCQRRNYCIPNPCNSWNSYYCTNGNYYYTCRCKAGYGGRNCDVDYCAGRCYFNGGRCIRSSYSPYYRCECKLAWTPESQCRTWGSRCLSINIKYARGLDDKDGFLAGDSDPYVRVYTYSYSGHRASVKTRHIKGDQSPDWNHWFNAGCGKNWYAFYFKVFDSDVGSDDSLSSGQYVYLTSLSSLPSYNYRVNLVGGRGYIVFDIYYY